MIRMELTFLLPSPLSGRVDACFSSAAGEPTLKITEISGRQVKTRQQDPELPSVSQALGRGGD